MLPSSSPGPQGSFRVQGADEDVGMTGLIGDDVEFQFDEPEFTFDEDGQLVEGPSVRAVARTSVGVGVPSGAARSARGHEVHVEGEAGEVQVSLSSSFRPSLHWNFNVVSCAPLCLPRSLRCYTSTHSHLYPVFPIRRSWSPFLG